MAIGTEMAPAIVNETQVMRFVILRRFCFSLSTAVSRPCREEFLAMARPHAWVHREEFNRVATLSRCSA